MVMVVAGECTRGTTPAEWCFGECRDGGRWTELRGRSGGFGGGGGSSGSGKGSGGYGGGFGSEAHVVERSKSGGFGRGAIDVNLLVTTPRKLMALYEG
ncbi:hypothetical protein AALP_AA7G110400 [Arabis alpina]|uniref:Uncharacterized protein n=1 Tax=Arabis alpina TaxID=50452 RepID=A0A087GHB3_ARAAL|nr:hypothetical protein AALP_AA7G110400 [Arabis alpina]